MRRITIFGAAAALIISGIFYTAQGNEKTTTTDLKGRTDSVSETGESITPDKFSNEPAYEEYGENKVLGSGVRGTVTIGPMCPVVMEGEDCPDKTYSATLDVWDNNRNFVKSIVSGENGMYELELEPGTYVVEPKSPNAMPFAEPKIILVESGKFTRADIVYDSGIR